jgi:hypothetical protein
MVTLFSVFSAEHLLSTRANHEFLPRKSQIAVCYHTCFQHWASKTNFKLLTLPHGVLYSATSKDERPTTSQSSVVFMEAPDECGRQEYVPLIILLFVERKYAL